MYAIRSYYERVRPVVTRDGERIAYGRSIHIEQGRAGGHPRRIANHHALNKRHPRRQHQELARRGAGEADRVASWPTVNDFTRPVLGRVRNQEDVAASTPSYNFV